MGNCCILFMVGSKLVGCNKAPNYATSKKCQAVIIIYVQAVFSAISQWYRKWTFLIAFWIFRNLSFSLSLYFSPCLLSLSNFLFLLSLSISFLRIAVSFSFLVNLSSSCILSLSHIKAKKIILLFLNKINFRTFSSSLSFSVV